jgi:hypothetical protein
VAYDLEAQADQLLVTEDSRPPGLCGEFSLQKNGDLMGFIWIYDDLMVIYGDLMGIFRWD